MAMPLIFDNAQLHNLRAYAEAHPISAAEMRLIFQGRAKVIGDRPGHSLNLPVGYRVVYSIEEVPLKDGTSTTWLRHMSMSLAVKGREPNILALELVSRELGFPSLPECLIQYNPEDGQPEILAQYKTGS